MARSVIPSTAPGGPYTLVAKSLDGFFPEERCEFQVRVYRVPRFKKELEFRRRSYGPGEIVEADFSAVRAEGGPLAGARVQVTATLDDRVIHRVTKVTSAEGTCLVTFSLPSLIDEGAGQLSITIDDGGTRETKSKTIPIQLGRVSVDFYPEGGYLVDGLENRVYFTARDSLGNPIHLAGEILTRSGQSVATVETVRDGMGRFALVPTRGERYALKVTQPVDVSNHPKLPSVVNELPVIDTGSGVFESRQPITMVLRTTKAMPVVVRAVCRGQLVGQQHVDLRAGDNSLSIPIHEDAGGVVRVTVLDSTSVPAQPLVERLVYRRQDKRLKIEILESSTAPQSSAPQSSAPESTAPQSSSALERSPGDALRLTLQVRDETGEPVAAVLGVSVVDDAALSLDEIERPQMETHFLLTSEVEKPEDLEHANFYLNAGEEASESLDLLLGTQGWRRFVSGSSAQPSVAFREQLIRLLELDGDAGASMPKQFDNSNGFAEQWLGYREAVGTAWQRLLYEARMLMFVVLFLWLLVILFHMRRQASAGVVGCLLIASTSLLLYGCSSSTHEVIVVGSDASGQSAARRLEEPADDMAMPESTAAPTTAPAAGSLPAETPSLRSVAVAEDPEFEATNPGLAVAGSPGSASQESHAQRLISERDLQRLLAARGIDAETLADQLMDELRFPIRQYAHRHSSDDSRVRQDFAETLCWQPMLITDSEGRATIRFDLSDSVTTFRVRVDAHSNDGRIGSGGGQITSRLPFQIEPKMPLEVTMGDRIDLPIAVINATDDTMPR